jgi:MFS family permease
MNPASVGLWLGLASGIGLVSGNLLGGFLSDYLATRNLRWYVLVPAIANLLTIPGILIFLLTESTTIALLAYVPTLMLTGSVTPPLIAAIMAISKPRMRALSYSAYYMTAVVIGMGGGPFIMGFMADFFSTQYQTEAIRYAMLYTSLSALFLATSGLFLASLSINRDKAE